MTVAISLITISLSILIIPSNAVEEAEPEAFLPPRNFNPHPYELGYNPRARIYSQQIYDNQIDSYPQPHHNTGPVLFPNPPQETGTSNAYNPRYKEEHPVDRNPYAGVQKKKKYRQFGRWQKEEQVNPQVYKALAAHGAKVLRIPQAEDLKQAQFDPTYSDQKKDYAFSYKVVDHLTGDDFSHTQSQNSQATNGEYRVKLPDGRVQIVSYTADKNGYNADVKYAENEESKVYGRHSSQYHTVPQTKTPQQYSYEDLPQIRQRLPVYNEYNTHQHLYQHINKNPEQKLINNYVNEQIIAATPKPYYYHSNPNPNIQLILPNKYQVIPEKVQLFSNAHEHKVRQFIASTLAPYTLDSSKGLGQNVAVSTLAPDLDKFSPVYIDVPNYRNAVSLQNHYKK